MRLQNQTLVKKPREARKLQNHAHQSEQTATHIRLRLVHRRQEGTLLISELRQTFQKREMQMGAHGHFTERIKEQAESMREINRRRTQGRSASSTFAPWANPGQIKQEQVVGKTESPGIGYSPHPTSGPPACQAEKEPPGAYRGADSPLRTKESELPRN